MPARVVWYDPDRIILYTVISPVTLDELEHAAEEVWALAAGVPDMVDIIFDYACVKEIPRGGFRLMKDGSFKLPNMDRVALVGSDSLIEMMFATIAPETYRADPSVHTNVDDAAKYLRRMAQEDRA